MEERSKNCSWSLPIPLEDSDPDIRANAVSLLKITTQWINAADSGSLLSPERLSSFLVAVISLTARMKDDDVLRERRTLLASPDQKHTDSINHLTHPIYLAMALAGPGDAGLVTYATSAS